MSGFVWCRPGKKLLVCGCWRRNIWLVWFICSPQCCAWADASRSFVVKSCQTVYKRLPVSFRQRCINHSADDVTVSNSSSTRSPLSSSITHSLFQSRLKTHLFNKSFSIHSVLAPTGLHAFSDYTGPDLFCPMVFIFGYFSFLLFWVVR